MANILLLVILVGLVNSGVSQNNCGGRLCANEEYCKDDRCVTKLPLGDPCTETGQCRAMYSECLGESGAMKCQCTSMWTSGPEGQCILNCATRNCSKNSFCSDLWHGCLLQSALNQHCNVSETSPLQCKNQYASCKKDSATCTCDFQEEFGSCIRSCAVDSSICQKETEYCDASGECKIKKSLSQACSASDECLPDNSECGSEGVCSCTGSFKNYMDIICVPECNNNADCPRSTEYCDLSKSYCAPKAYLAQPCHSGSQESCATPNAECSASELCACSTNYVESQNFSTCLPEATKIGDECGEIQQCYTLAPGENYATQCSNGMCSCITEYVGNTLQTKCLKIAKNLLETCVEDQQCESLSGGPESSTSKCVAGKCSCQTGFIEGSDLQTCLKEATKIGDVCDEIQQCFILAPGESNATECTSKKCACSTEYVGNSLETKCLKKADQLEDTCVEDQQCSSLAEEIECGEEGKCSCKEGFRDNEDKKSCTKSNGSRMGSGFLFTVFAAVVIKYFVF